MQSKSVLTQVGGVILLGGGNPLKLWRLFGAFWTQNFMELSRVREQWISCRSAQPEPDMNRSDSGWWWHRLRERHPAAESVLSPPGKHPHRVPNPLPSPPPPPSVVSFTNTRNVLSPQLTPLLLFFSSKMNNFFAVCGAVSVSVHWIALHRIPNLISVSSSASVCHFLHKHKARGTCCCPDCHLYFW